MESATVERITAAYWHLYCTEGTTNYIHDLRHDRYLVIRHTDDIISIVYNLRVMGFMHGATELIIDKIFNHKILLG